MNIPQINFTPKIHQDIGIEIVALSDIYKIKDSKARHMADKPHRIKFHNLLYITKGEGNHFIDFNTYTVEDGSVVFIHKNQIHAFDLTNKPQGKLIMFTDEFLNTMYASMKSPLISPHHLLTTYTPSFILNDVTKKTCDVLVDEIIKEHELKQPSLPFLTLLFSALLTKLFQSRPQLFDQQLSEVRAKVFTQFIKQVENNFTITRDAKVYADMQNMTYKSLNHICKLATKQTAKQLIDAHTILEAKRKLSISDIRIQQLADQLGFDEVTNFVKYFKKNTLMTPSQFKKTVTD